MFHILAGSPRSQFRYAKAKAGEQSSPAFVSSPPGPLSILERGNCALDLSQFPQPFQHLHHRPRVPLAVVQQILPHTVVLLTRNLARHKEELATELLQPTLRVAPKLLSCIR